MRWVLGEQSARQLRGTRMDDVIFAGNSQRRPLGMAEVTLTFDNSDGALPTPFAELAITRRAYRSGESEFFLNKSQVRLRDITDLLLGTGLAAELAAIVSQGEIDAILSAKPEARRELFEGVAGTARYRARKREAQRRLEQTATNALRLNDLLIELEKQIPAIEQQVRRAKRYQKVNTQLRDFEILSYVRKTAERRDERARIVASLGADEHEAAAAAKQHSELQAALSKARAEEYQASLALDGRNAEHTTLAEQLQEHASAHAASGAKTAELVRALESLEREVDAAANAATRADARLSAAIEELRRSREARDEALGLAESAASVEATGTAQWERAYSALRAVEDARTRAAARSAQSASAAVAADHEVERLGDEAKRLAGEIGAADSGVERSRARQAQLGADCEALTAQAATLAAALRGAEEETTAAAKAVEDARRAREQAHGRLVQLTAKRDALKELEAGTAGAPAGTAALLEAAASGALAGILGPLARQISVDDRNAIAIDALLGVHAHDVVVRTLDDGKAAMRLLKSMQAGRATIIALEALPRGRGRGSSDAGPGIVGRAADLVTCDPALAPAIDHVLGQSFVVATLDDAFACSQKMPDAAFVTQDGDVIRGGVISTGAGVGPVGAHAALSALEDELKSHADAARSSDGVLDAAVRALDAARLRVEERKRDGAALALRQHDAAAAREHEAHEQVTLADRLSALRELHDKLKGQLAAAQATAQRHRESAAELSREVDGLESQRREALTTADSLAQELSGVRGRHREAAANAAALVERVAQLSDDVETSRAELERAQAQRKERLASLAGMREEREHSAAEVERLAALRGAAETALGGGRIWPGRAARTP